MSRTARHELTLDLGNGGAMNCRTVTISLCLGFLSICTGCKPKPQKEIIYENQAPAFTLRYPESWKPEKPRTTHEVFRATHPMSVPTLNVDVFEASTVAILTDRYPAKFLETMQAMFPKASDFKVISSNPVALPNGITGLGSQFEWVWEDHSTRLVTCNVSIIRDGKLISASCTGLRSDPIEDLAKYPRSLALSR